MTVRAWFRLNRRALWEREIGVAVEFHKLANAVAEGDESTARAALDWLLDDLSLYRQLREPHRYQGITQ